MNLLILDLIKLILQLFLRLKKKNNSNESQVSMFDGVRQSTKNPIKLYFYCYFNEKCLFEGQKKWTEFKLNKCEDIGHGIVALRYLK